MSVTSISNAYINTNLFRWHGAYFEVSWTWSPGHRCQEVTHDFQCNAEETIHIAERLFVLLIYTEALSLKKLNCASLKDRKIFKNECKVTEKLTSWGFWLPIRLCCCSYNEKIIQNRTPIIVPFTLQVGIKGRRDVKGETNSSLAIAEKDKLTELWTYTKALPPRNGIASCNLLINMVHGKNPTLMRDCFSRQIFNLGIWEILSKVKWKREHGLHIMLADPS